MSKTTKNIKVSGGVNVKVTSGYVRNDHEAICGVFCINNDWFFADIIYTEDHGIECMIFHSDENGEITDWADLYSNLNVKINEESLIACINEFFVEYREKKNREIQEYYS